MTMTVPLSACTARTCAAIACCASHWMSRSIVSCTPVPGTAGDTTSWPSGIGEPDKPVSKVRSPSRPERKSEAKKAGLEGALAVAAGEELLVRRLEPRDAIAVGVDEADQVGREC